ncbi:MAG: minor capsid protein, partial [Actinobacteria bacterium]|nr:minor capsid protein [Actinomycetota bacterium]
MPDIDPDLPLRLAKTIADIYGDAATQLLQAVARRLARGIDEPGWAESKMAELVGLRDEARAVVDRLTVLGSDAVREALTAATDKGATAAATELA